MTRTTILCGRVSTKAQAEEGYAGEGHLHELREHMTATGRRIVEEVPDDPGEKRWMHDRPGIRRLKGLARAGKVAEVWAWSWTRYGESPVPPSASGAASRLSRTARATTSNTKNRRAVEPHAKR